MLPPGMSGNLIKIKEVGVILRDKTLVCRECNQRFTFTTGEQEFYQSRGLLNEPGRCPQCRAARRQERRDGAQQHSVICASCGRETTVPFEPRQRRPVYCRDCYSKVRNSVHTTSGI